VSSISENQNPLSEFISDEVFSLLSSKKLLNEKSLRDYQIRKKFKSLRRSNINACDAIDMIRNDHPYLQFDTVRKIVYDIK
jgi:hypothetical protein